MALDFEDIILEKEQDDLLIALVEAARQQPRDQRDRFMFTEGGGKAKIAGLRGFSNPFRGDIVELANQGLLNLSYGQYSAMMFDVSARGFRYYEYLMQKRGEPAERVEQTTIRYLDTSGFEERHPEAFAKWRQSEELLWSSDTAQQHTAVGHHCREAMQLFATSLVEKWHPLDVEQGPTKTVSRLRSVLDQAKAEASDSVVVMLDALLVYWGTVSDLAQRQEHGEQKGGEALTWEDSRRLVLQTAIVMTEIDRTLKDLNP